MKTAVYVILVVAVLVPLSITMDMVAVHDVRDARQDKRDARATGGFQDRVMAGYLSASAWRAIVLSVALIGITIAIIVSFLVRVAT